MPALKKETTVKKGVPNVSKGKTESVEAKVSNQAIKLSSNAAKTKKAQSLNSSIAKFSVPVYSLLGKAAGTLDLPKSVFGVEVNKALINQALRVYLNNQKGHFSNTKTRGEVEGSTRKIYKQKGTGRARHGGIRANIFVGGGIALGPKSRQVILELPKKMKKASLISGLSQKLLDKQVFGISGLDKVSGKTSELVKFIKAIEKKSALIVTDKVSDLAARAAANLKTVNLVGVSDLNTLEIIKAQSLIFTKEAVEVLEKKVTKGTEVIKATKVSEKEKKQ